LASVEAEIKYYPVGWKAIELTESE